MALNRWISAMVLALLFCSASLAQTPKVFRIGLLHVGIPNTCILSPLLREAFAHHGYVEGKTVTFEPYAVEGQFDRMPGMIDQMIAHHVDLIVTCGYPTAAFAKDRAGAIPVLVVQAGDPVETGMVASLAHPGGHITGVSEVSTDLSAKRLQLLKEAVPGIQTVAVLWNQDDLGMSLRGKALQDQAKRLGVATQMLGVRAPNDFTEAFAEMDRHPPDAILLIADSLTVTNHQAVFDYAAQHHLPHMEEIDFLARLGGLMAYGPDDAEVFDRIAALADRILHGAKPADLPLEVPTRFRFSVNLKRAHVLGLTIPDAVLARSDEVIE